MSRTNRTKKIINGLVSSRENLATVFNMEILFLIGLTIFFGTLCGKLIQQLKFPQVTGYLIAGLILGNSFLKIWTPESIEAFSPFMDFALGIIGFLIGSELKASLFKNRNNFIYSILFCESFVTFFVVTAVTTFITKQLYLGVLFGALASATAPAATVDVLWEYKSKGPLTSTLLAIVALDDVTALLIYAFAAMFARNLLVHEVFSGTHIFHAIEEIFLGFGVGIISGFILYWLTHFIKEKDRILPFALGVLALSVGVASHFKLDLILSSILIGVTLTNIAPQDSEEIFTAIRKISPPIYILFFGLVGAQLDIHFLAKPALLILAIAYVVSRTVGKLSGAYLGGLIGKAPTTVTKYLGLGLFSQAGVAIGMAISIQNNLSGLSPEAAQASQVIVNVLVGTTFIVQLIGPICVKVAISKANECWRNLTEEDIIAPLKVEDLIESDVPIIREDAHLDILVGLVKSSESYDFCVVNNDDSLRGYITIGDLRDVLLEQSDELGNLIFARDLAHPATRVVEADKPLKEAIEIMERRNLDFIPVVRDLESNKFVGLIHMKHIRSEVSSRLFERREGLSQKLA